MKGQHQTDALVSWDDSVRLRQIRRERGWTQLELSIRLGISESTLQLIERGQIRGRRVYIQEVVSSFLDSYAGAQ